MGNKALAPGYLRLTYTGVLFPHHQTLPVKWNAVPEPGSEPTLQNKGGTGVLMSDAVADYLALYKKFFPVAVKFGLVEAHAVDEDTGEDTFIYALNAGVTGDNAVARVATGEFILTMKTSVGGSLKIYGMEPSEAANQKFLPPFDDIPNTDNLSDWLVSDDGWIYGRGNSWPFVPVSYITKYNDALRRQQGKS